MTKVDKGSFVVMLYCVYASMNIGISGMHLDESENFVHIQFNNGKELKVNVAGDSNLGIYLDVNQAMKRHDSRYF